MTIHVGKYGRNWDMDKSRPIDPEAVERPELLITALLLQHTTAKGWVRAMQQAGFTLAMVQDTATEWRISETPTGLTWLSPVTGQWRASVVVPPAVAQARAALDARYARECWEGREEG